MTPHEKRIIQLLKKQSPEFLYWLKLKGITIIQNQQNGVKITPKEPNNG